MLYIYVRLSPLNAIPQRSVFQSRTNDSADKVDDLVFFMVQKFKNFPLIKEILILNIISIY